MIRMHAYPSGLTGLAAFCDTCGEQITEHGYVVWNPDDVTDFLIVHQARCDPGIPGNRSGYDCSMPLDAEIIYLANSAGVDLEAAQKRVGLVAMIG